MFKWVFRQCLDAMGKKRTAEVKMVGASDAEEAIQALDVGYTATVELIHAQAHTIARLQKELQEAQSGGGASGSKEKVQKKKKEEKTEEPASEKKDEPEEAEKKEEPEKKILEMPESPSGEPSSGVKGPEKSLEGAPVELKPSPTQESADVEIVEGPKTLEPKGRSRPAPSEGHSEWEDSEPPWKKPRGDQSDQWLCFRCLKVCGDKSKHCRVAVNALTDAALLSNWVRVALKSRPDSRGEFAELSREMAARRLKQPGSREMGEHAIRELRRAESLGVAPPPELFEKQPIIEEVREAPPMDPTISGTSPLGSMGSERESDAEYGARVRALLEALQSSSATETLKAQIVASLQRK